MLQTLKGTQIENEKSFSVSYVYHGHPIHYPQVFVVMLYFLNVCL